MSPNKAIEIFLSLIEDISRLLNELFSRIIRLAQK